MSRERWEVAWTQSFNDGEVVSPIESWPTRKEAHESARKLREIPNVTDVVIRHIFKRRPIIGRRWEVRYDTLLAHVWHSNVRKAVRRRDAFEQARQTRLFKYSRDVRVVKINTLGKRP